MQFGVVLSTKLSKDNGLIKTSSASIKVIQLVLQLSKHLCRAKPGPVFYSQDKIVIFKSGYNYFKKSYLPLSSGASLAIIISQSFTIVCVNIELNKRYIVGRA